MSRKSIVVGVVLGVLTGVVVIAVAYAGQQLAGVPFFPFDVFEITTRMLPGPLVAASIGLMVKVITGLSLGPLSQTAKLAEQAMGLLLFLCLAAVTGAAAAVAVRRSARRDAPTAGLGVGLAAFTVMLLIEAALGFQAGGPLVTVLWLLAVFACWGLALGWLAARTLADAPAAAMTAGAPALLNRSRRSLIYLGGTAILALIAAALGLADALNKRAAAPGGSAPEAVAGSAAGISTPVPPASSGPAASPPQAALAARMAPAPGTRPELTDNKDFYRIDIDLLPPGINAGTWRLPITGLVQKPVSLTLDDLRARPAVSQYVTMSCISNLVGGELISTSLWTGTPLKDLLDELGLKPGARELYIQAADGFYESVYHEDMLDERTLLVYEMNGQPLTMEHGFPLRIYIANRFGMKQPKWITSMEVIDHPGRGYWVDRGWSAQATAQTTAVIDGPTTRNVDSKTNTLPIGGIAWAGARGVSKLEVSVDHGPWVAAQLRNPPLSPLTWVQWRYDWPVGQPGEHVVAARAYDGQGALQSQENHTDFPNGATGVFSWAFKV